MRPVLIAPGAFADLRASQVAAAIGRGLEREGLRGDLCPATDGGPGTLEALLVALGGEAVAGGFALVEGGRTALIDGLPDPDRAAAAVVAARDSGASAIVLAARGMPAADLSAIDLGHVRLVIPDAAFVLDALGFDTRMRAARAVITGAGQLGERDLRGTLVAEVATRARQSGVPCFAIAAHSDLDLFGARMLDLQVVATAATLDGIESAAQAVAPHLPSS